MGLVRRGGVSMTTMIKRGSMWFVKRIGVEIEPVRVCTSIEVVMKGRMR